MRCFGIDVFPWSWFDHRTDESLRSSLGLQCICVSVHWYEFVCWLFWLCDCFNVFRLRLRGCVRVFMVFYNSFWVFQGHLLRTIIFMGKMRCKKIFYEIILKTFRKVVLVSLLRDYSKSCGCSDVIKTMSNMEFKSEMISYIKGYIYFI